MANKNLLSVMVSIMGLAQMGVSHAETPLSDEATPLVTQASPSETGDELSEGFSLLDDGGEITQMVKLPLSELLKGFTEVRVGTRLHSSDTASDVTLEEARIQLNTHQRNGFIDGFLTMDLNYDRVEDSHRIEMHRGKGWLDLRQLYFDAHPTKNFHILVGRQILDWGIGDLVFINDRFAKDWESFVVGRDEAYLFAPTNALSVAYSIDYGTLTVLWAPRHDHDRYVDGLRVAYTDVSTGLPVNLERPVTKRRNWFQDHSYAVRYEHNLADAELALYVYSGFSNAPMLPSASAEFEEFTREQSYGLSLLIPEAHGSFISELAYIRSSEAAFEYPGIRPSRWEGLIGYQWSPEPLTEVSLQLVGAHLVHPAPPKINAQLLGFKRDKLDTVVRLKRPVFLGTTEAALINFWSPTERSGYLRLGLSQKFDHDFIGEVGMSYPYGAYRDTRFGELENAANWFTSLRYTF